MSGSRFRPFTRQQFEVLMNEMGFLEISRLGTFEHTYERLIANVPSDRRFAVRIYSTVDVGTGVTRQNGSDAIRVMVYDTLRNRPVTDWNVHRTTNAFTNTKERAREAWRYVLNSKHHCTCGCMMVERNGKHGPFLGCTNYPKCKNTR